ncbi:extracellular solute-binding protein [Paenibacillus sp. ACRRX]|uniref:ABC transporter substrate-binding protein n=1 Tax=Paenibacillus sp. ACRRX TaxID=2918206 RepID=UPI001EF6657E|nr:extracellular solute-binding protein [Paenibacillus sp. ACRRX]MCG7406869.1 extracellular solute-binding protein [Paenibacillus sp. ACRRX]
MKNKWIEVAISCVCLMMITACGTGGDRDNDKKEKSSTKEGKVIVTLSISEPEPFYEAAERKFEAKYPHIDLQIKSFKKPGEKWEAGEMDKYKKSIDVAMLAGTSADLIELSGLPAAKYVSKKLLLDLNEKLKQDQTLSQQDLQMNIVDALKKDGGLYTLPASFSLRTFVGDEAFLLQSGVTIDDENWTWQQFEQTARKLVELSGQDGKEPRYALTAQPADLTLVEQLFDRYSQFVNRKNQTASFDSPVFIDMMEQVQQMYKDKVITDESTTESSQLFYSDILASADDFIRIPYMYFSQPKFLQKPHAKGETGKARIILPLELGIQAKSAVKEEAWTFIAFLLSEDAQLLSERDGFSMLRSLNDKKLEDMKAQVKKGAYKLADGKVAQVAEKQFDQFKTVINTADNLQELDAKVLSIIYTEAPFFFSGHKSAKEVAQLIQNRVNTYLKE